MAACAPASESEVSAAFCAELVGNDVLVWDMATATALRREHRLGMSGIGGLRQTKAHVRRKAGTLPLILTPFETRLGLERGILKVLHTAEGQAARELTWREISPHFQLSDRWELVYAVYADLYSHGWFFTDGLRFGVDFLLYGADPSTAHAPLMLTVAEGASLRSSQSPAQSSSGEADYSATKGISPVHLASLQRVAHRSAKQVLLAWVRCFEDGSPGTIVYQEITRSYSPAPLPEGVEYV